MTNDEREEDGNEAASDDEVTPKRGTFDISKLRLDREIESPLGTLRSWPVSIDDYRVIMDAEKAEPFDAERFAQLLIQQAVTREKKDNKLSRDEVETLAADTEFLENLISAHPEFYTEFEDDPSPSGGEGMRSQRRRRVERISREEGEAPQEFLLRAWREYDRKNQASMKRIQETMQKSLGGLSSALSSSGLKSLGDSLSAADRLREAVLGSSGLRSLGDSFSTSHRLRDDVFGTVHPTSVWSEPREFKLPPIPPNPIHETNAHLESVADSIEQMRELAIETAEMQRGLNAVATEILNNFVTGAETAGLTATKNLRIAKIALAVAVLSVLATVAVAFFQWATDGADESELVAQQQTRAILEAQLEASRSQIDLLRQSLREAKDTRVAVEEAAKPKSPSAAEH